MTRLGFEPTIPAWERAKTVHASDRAATAIGDFLAEGDKVSISVEGHHVLGLVEVPRRPESPIHASCYETKFNYEHCVAPQVWRAA
jgi:hypothetical protein